MSTALLLIAHGSRQAEANTELVQLADDLRQSGPYAVVEPSYLEIAAPTIEQGAERCVTQGVARVVLVPYFLSAGMHARNDLREHCNALSAKFAGIEFVLADPLGPHPLLAEIVLQRARNADGAQ